MTTTELIEEFNSEMWMPDCPADVAAKLLNRTWRDILTRVHAWTGSQTISLTAGTVEYSLTDCFHVADAYYEPSSDAAASYALIPTSLEELRAEYSNWRANSDRNLPLRFYTSSVGGTMKIGFSPIPSEGTGSGYPRVTVHGTFYSELTDIPSCLLSEDVILTGMALRWVRRTQPEKIAYYTQLYKDQVDANVIHVEGKQEQVNFSLRGPAFRLTQTV